MFYYSVVRLGLTSVSLFIYIITYAFNWFYNLIKIKVHTCIEIENIVSITLFYTVSLSVLYFLDTYILNHLLIVIMQRIMRLTTLLIGKQDRCDFSYEQKTTNMNHM